MFLMLNDIEKKAEMTSKRVIYSFVSIIIAQFFVIQYGTFIAFSWDIMEPITCGMTLGDAALAYLFWVWSKKPYSLAGLREFFFERKKKKLIKRHGLDYSNFIRTEMAIKIIKERINELS